ncbi:S-formylglutathione hydrolase FghA (plasmid) [Cupriavidus necator N-1]|uniref:S-formylglutathione hydrolase n=1 Tax=Cupriavidus necator (strain ATCC 43291 / DSM 13513 / CCUG 52238 / LMG 8453 / N-1) TaxID=1042878 RepID=F8GVC7_CUPNN|nr:S-formylglutathione hydrolase [Cupriavidus necator]AEI82627.1 S-formylglutathione hydrolase FghA [Cupriavidus necator N-1]MDX6007624.1 S-formylglutathione hydrolase [Cupriavidus necator]
MLELISEHCCHGGSQRVYRHQSETIGLPMRFSVFLPAQVLRQWAGEGEPIRRFPALIYLAGLTCNEDTFMTKAGAQRLAAARGLILVAPDTSPRDAGIQAESTSWDFGVGAGFYVDATEDPWSVHWRMESYVVRELFGILTTVLPADANRVGIFGHSMGGHGALVLAQRHPRRFRSVSAFAPICAPVQSPWGEKAFTGYLGPERNTWGAYDASALMRRQSRPPYPEGILVDQGLADKFLQEQLKPEIFQQACESVLQPLILRRHEGYDHGYFFITTFIEDHIHFHASILAGAMRPLLTGGLQVRHDTPRPVHPPRH